MRKVSWSAFLVLSLALCLAIPVMAQTNRGVIVGSITDKSGAGVPDATVKVVNVETEQAFTATTNKEGRYVAPGLLPGRYHVEVSQKGFKTAISDIVDLPVGSTLEVSLALQVGTVAEKVTVTATGTELQTESSNLGEVISGRQITELPLKDRNFTTLAELAPGVSRSLVSVLTDSQAFNQGDGRFGQGDVPGSSNNQGSTESARFSRSGGASISVNGLRPTTNNFSLDGVDNNEPQFGTIGVFPNPDAIQEFKVDTGVSKAEVGRGGANINVDIKSGTNDLHGTLYYYGQNNALNAQNYGLGYARSKNPGNLSLLAPSQLRVNEFGFTVGGPIIKNKLFFFGDYLGQRNATPNAFATVVPTALSRTGDFSEFTTPIIDPQTCATPGDISSGGCRTFVQETGKNAIPSTPACVGCSSTANIIPQAMMLLALYPLPTKLNVTNPNQGNQNYFGVRNNTEKIDSFDVKADYKLSGKNTVSGRYTRDNQERDRANEAPKVPTMGFGAGNEIGNTRQVAVNDVHLFKPTLLNEARFGWTQVSIGILNCGVEGACGISATACQDLGIPNCNTGAPAASGGILTGGFGTGEFEFTGDGGLFLVHSNNFTAADSLTLITGKHTWKFGAEARPRRLDTLDGGRAGGLKGGLQYGPGGGNQSTGNVQSDYLLARPAINATHGGILGGDNPFQLRTTEWAAYVQDDWKVSPNLTVNLGLRYDIYPAYHEASGRIANWDITNRTVIRTKGSGDNILETQKKDFGPRVGLAYNFGPQKKFVARAAYGIFYAQDGVDRPPLTENPPLTRGVNFNGGGFFGGTSNFNLATGPPDATPVDPPVVTPNSNLFFVPLSQKTPMLQQFSFGGQWEFARDWLLDIGYVGTRSHHLLTTRELGAGGNGLGLSKTAAGAVTTTNPNPDSFINSTIAYEDRSSANYNALQTSLEKRFSHNVQGRVNYTWSHNIDDSTGVFNGLGEARGTNGGPANPFNLEGEKSNSSLDRRHLFIANVIWDLPFGHGQQFGANAAGIADKLISGWQWNIIQSAGSGQPFGVLTDSPCPAGAPASCSNIGRVRGDQICANPYAGVTGGEYLNPACFATPSMVVTNLAGRSFVVGNTGRNPYVGPRYVTTDFSVFKNTSFRERYKVQFGMEFFNLWNKANKVVPDTCLCNNFGVFESALPPRQIQYRLKIFF